MFGYIRPEFMELKVKDAYKYKDYYCCLCYSLRTNYGQIFGCILNYDLTFLLLVLDSIEPEKKESLEFHCPLNPLRKIKVNISITALSYSSFINYYLVKMKLDDDITDERSLLKRILNRIIINNKRFIRITHVYNDLITTLESSLTSVYEAEQKMAPFDDITNKFGSFFNSIFIAYFQIYSQNTISKEILENIKLLSNNLGKWIYLIDAYDDYFKDQKKGSFNLLNTLSFRTNPDNDSLVLRVRQISNILIYNMKTTVNKLPLKEKKELVENIVTYGCSSQMQKVVAAQINVQYRNLHAKFRISILRIIRRIP